VPGAPQGRLMAGKGEGCRCGRCRSGCRRNQPRTGTPQQCPKSLTGEGRSGARTPRTMLLKPKGHARQQAVETAALRACQPHPGGLQETPAPRSVQRRQQTRRHGIRALLSSGRSANVQAVPRLGKVDWKPRSTKHGIVRKGKQP